LPLASISIRVDPETEAFLTRFARVHGQTKSEVVRDALAALRKRASGKRDTLPPAQAMADVIGCWDSGGMNLSEDTGQKFSDLLRAKRNVSRSGRRRPARRSD
jgi:hypothetical protein